MTTAVIEKPTNQSVSKLEDREVSYAVDGEKIVLKIGTVLKYLCHPTRSGKKPDSAEVIKFMMLCQTQKLNPWVGDAYLVGYDTKDGPTFNLITSAQALLKRAEANQHFDGMESGVIYSVPDDPEPKYGNGDFLMHNWALLGGWAKVYRSDRKIAFYDALKLNTFDTGQSRWRKDPAGMIVKCAECSALRTAFPNACGGLYIRDEMDSIEFQKVQSHSEDREPATISDVKTRMLTGSKPQAEKNSVSAQPEPEQVKPASGEPTPEELAELSEEFDPEESTSGPETGEESEQDSANRYLMAENEDAEKWELGTLGSISTAKDTETLQLIVEAVNQHAETGEITPAMEGRLKQKIDDRWDAVQS